MRTTKDLLQDLANLNPKEQIYIVSLDYVDVKIKKTCPECKGKGYFEIGKYRYDCKECGGSGILSDRKLRYIVESNINTYDDLDYPDIKLEYGTIQMTFFNDIQGFFNNKKEAQKLADKLNKETNR